MDINLARDVIRAAFRSARELQGLLPSLKEGCKASEYEMYLKGVARVLADLSLEVTNKVIAEHPELEAEIEAGIAEHGDYR
jgi:hypothetical protein